MHVTAGEHASGAGCYFLQERLPDGRSTCSATHRAVHGQRLGLQDVQLAIVHEDEERPCTLVGEVVQFFLGGAGESLCLGGLGLLLAEGHELGEVTWAGRQVEHVV